MFLLLFLVSVLKNVVGNYSCETKNPQFYGGAVIKVHMSSFVRHKMQDPLLLTIAGVTNFVRNLCVIFSFL